MSTLFRFGFKKEKGKLVLKLILKPSGFCALVEKENIPVDQSLDVQYSRHFSAKTEEPSGKLYSAYDRYLALMRTESE